ncbi:CvpA family protein [uncultured Robinsoniella sp.]|uniref:CvpA family protein n=1 Tax=uncultured Robinsoniella sp. TaxID=904190 RepID=UPI00374F80B7
MNLLTIIVLLVLLFFILNGFRRGFIKTFVSMVSLIVSIVLVSIATPYVTEFLKTQTPLYSMIEEKCQSAFGVTDKQNKVNKDAQSGDNQKSDIPNSGGLNSENQNPNSSDGENQGQNGSGQNSGNVLSLLDQAKLIEELQLPEVIRNMLESNNNKTGYEKLAVQSFEEYIPSYMATLILNIISFVATFLLVVSFLWITVMTLDVIANLPIIHGINQVLGLVLGLVQGLVFVWIAFLIITVLSSIDLGRDLMLMIHNSKILSFIYDNNIFLKLLTDAMSYFT